MGFRGGMVPPVNFSILKSQKCYLQNFEGSFEQFKRKTKVKLLFLVVGSKKNLFLRGAKDILASVNKMFWGEGAARLSRPPASYATHCLVWLGVL